MLETKSVMKDYTIVPNKLLRSSNLSISARYFLCVLLRYCRKNDFCFTGQDKLAIDLGFSSRHVRNLLKELEDAGALKKQRVGYNTTNNYIISMDYIWDGNGSSYAKTARNSNSSAHNGSAVPVYEGSEVPTNNTLLVLPENNISEEKREENKKKLQQILKSKHPAEEARKIYSNVTSDTSYKVFNRATGKLESVKEIIDNKLSSKEIDNTENNLITDRNQVASKEDNATPTETQHNKSDKTDASNVDSHQEVQR